MLWLKRNIYWNQLERCDVSGENIYPGDYYYQDDVDGIKIKATVYKDMQNKLKEDTWDYSKINNATCELEYKQMLKRATQDILAASILDRKIAGKYTPNPDVEDEYVQDLYDAALNKFNGKEDDN